MNQLAANKLKEYQQKVKSGEIERAAVKTPLQKQQGNPTSLRKSITAFCWVCVGESRKDVTNCTAKQCPLYAVRPWQGNAEDSAEDSSD